MIALAALIFAGMVIYMWREIQPYLDRSFALLDKVTEKPKLPEVPKMPEVLVRMAAIESAPWARDQKLSLYRELYEDLGDWNQVITAVLTEEAKNSL